MIRRLRATTALGALAILTIAYAPAPRAAAPAGAATPVFIAEGASRTGYQPSDRQLAQWALDTWTRQAAGGFAWTASPEETAIIRLYWSPPRIQAFGEVQPIEVNGQRGSAVYIRADTRQLGSDLAERVKADPLWRDTIVYLTCLHEIGHAIGLEHTRDFADIMYSFQHGGDVVEYFGRFRRQLKTRADIPSASAVSAADVQRLRARHR